MTTRIRRNTTTTITATLPDDLGEVELEYEPHDEDNILAERVGDKLVIAYLVQDQDPSVNPLKYHDCQGDLYTKTPYSARDGVITDNDSEFYRALGLDSGGDIDADRDITVNGVTDSLWNFAAEAVWLALDEGQLANQLLACHRWPDIDLTAEQVEKLENEPSRQMLTHLRLQHGVALMADLKHPNGYHCDLVWDRVASLYEDHWQEIAGPLVVPVECNRGNYASSYNVTTWDGDTDDLPDGVWVADKGATENIGDGCHKGVVINAGKETYKGPNGWIVEVDGNKVAFFPRVPGPDAGYGLAEAFVDAHYSHRPMDVHTAARHYADGVLEEYSQWCSGEVYGCVVHTYDLKSEDDGEPQWVKGAVDIGDECWGFIGEEYAVEALANEFFEPTVKRLLQKPQFITADDSEGGLTD